MLTIVYGTTIQIGNDLRAAIHRGHDGCRCLMPQRYPSRCLSRICGRACLVDDGEALLINDIARSIW